MRRFFNISNERDVRDLFDILPDNVMKLEKIINNDGIKVVYDRDCYETTDLLKILWGDKLEVTRPKAEATNEDIGRLCIFWDDKEEEYDFCCSILLRIDEREAPYIYIPRGNDVGFKHCRRLTKEEIEELC